MADFSLRICIVNQLWAAIFVADRGEVNVQKPKMFLYNALSLKLYLSKLHMDSR